MSPGSHGGNSSRHCECEFLHSVPCKFKRWVAVVSFMCRATTKSKKFPRSVSMGDGKDFKLVLQRATFGFRWNSTK